MKSLLGPLFNQGPPVSYAPRGNGVPYSFSLGKNSKDSSLKAMGSLGDVYAIVTLLASTTSSVDWHLFRKPSQDMRQRYSRPGPPGQDAADRVEVLQHPALYLWEKPNDFNTNQMFVESFQQHLELVGEAYWVTDYVGNTPVSMWVVNPARMEPVPSARNYLAGYVYTGPNGEQVPLQPNEVTMLKYPNPWDPYHGLGPVQSIMIDIQNVQYSAQWNRNFWLNNAAPGGIIEIETKWTDTDFDDFTKRWRETHRGISGAGKIGLLEGGAKWVDVQKTMKEMQGAEIRQVSQDSIRRAWGIHKHMLGDAEDVNRANAETAEETFVRWKTVPRLDRIKDALNNFWLPQFGSVGQNVEFAYSNPVPEDREAGNAELTAKANAAKTLVDAGYDPEAVCEVVGLPSMDFVGSATNPSSQPAAEPAAEPDDAMESMSEEDQEQMQNELTEMLRMFSLNGHQKVGAR